MIEPTFTQTAMLFFIVAVTGIVEPRAGWAGMALIALATAYYGWPP